MIIWVNYQDMAALFVGVPKIEHEWKLVNGKLKAVEVKRVKLVNTTETLPF